MQNRMKTSALSLVALVAAVVALAGCGRQPVYTQSYQSPVVVHHYGSYGSGYGGSYSSGYGGPQVVHVHHYGSGYGSAPVVVHHYHSSFGGSRTVVHHYHH